MSDESREVDPAEETGNHRRAIALTALILATILAVVWTFWPQDEKKPAPVAEPTPSATPTPEKPKVTACGPPAKRPFRPTRISVKGVAANSEVLGLGRDGNNVPRAADLTAAGKTQYGWDDPTKATENNPLRPTGAYPGATEGNVLINAHTWPDGQPPSLGNKLLANLHVGDLIVVKGKSSKLCYKVTKRVVIVATDGSAEYYRADGPPQLALIVCSPPRLGPGNWLHRTIWFASPVTSAADVAAAAS